MMSISLILFIILLTLLSNTISTISNIKITNGISFTITFLIYCLFIITFDLINVNILSASKLFWVLLILTSVLLFFITLFKCKPNNKPNTVFITLFIVSISIILINFSKGYMSSTSLLPLSNVSSGIETALNYINNTITLNQSNFLVLYFTSFISLIPNNVSLLTISSQIVQFMQFIAIFLMVDFFTNAFINSKTESFSFILACILCLPYLLGYELLAFGYTNQLYLLIFTYTYLSLTRTKYNLLFLIISLLTIPFILGFNTYSLIYITDMFLISLLSNKDNQKQTSILSLIILCISISSIIIFKDKIVFNIQDYINPNQQNLFIPFFSNSNGNIYVTLFIMILLFISSLTRCRFTRLISIISLIVSSIVLLNTVDISTKFTLFYLIFNPIILAHLFNLENIDSSYYNAVLIATILLSCYAITEKNLVNPYYEDSQTYNKKYRIDNNELGIYSFLLNNYQFNEQVKIISQAPNTSYFLPNITLLENYPEQMNRCQYCNVNAMNLHEPNALVNIFAYREYGGNVLFIEEPQYEQGCKLLDQNEYNFLILRSDQTIDINGNWYNLSDYYSQCYSIIYKNDFYVLLGKA